MILSNFDPGTRINLLEIIKAKIVRTLGEKHFACKVTECTHKALVGIHWVDVTTIMAVAHRKTL